MVDAPVSNEPFHVQANGLNNFRNALAEIKASLNGPMNFSFATGSLQGRSVDLSKFLDTVSPVNIRAKLGDNGSGIVFPDTTLNGLFPQGLDLEKQRQKHGADLLGVLFTGREKPLISTNTSSILLIEISNCTSGPQSITISNHGTSPLQVSSVQLTSGNSQEFRISSGTCGSFAPMIPASGSCAVSVSFKHPTVAGNKYASLTITSNDSAQPTATVGVIGYTLGDGTDLVVKGDPNNDGIVNVFDALLTLQYAVGLIEHTPDNNIKYLDSADVAPLDAGGKPKGDTQVNVSDALAILRHAVGLDLW